MAAGMKRIPAKMTRKACNLEVEVVSLVSVDILQRVTFERLRSFILLKTCCTSYLVIVFCLRAQSSQQRTINNSYLIILLLSLAWVRFLIGVIIRLWVMRENEEKGISFKVILIGDSGIGKTSLIQKYIHGSFKDEYQVTVGVDFSSKIVIVDGKPVQLQIWDTCGQDIYKAITNNFYRGAAAVFLVYAIDNRESFERLKQWLEQFYEKGSDNAFIFLIGTKCDLDRSVEVEQGFQFMKSIKGAFFIETSAKDDIKVDELFFKAAQTMYKFYQVSKDYRDLVKPQRMTMSVAFQNPRITLSNSVFQQQKAKQKKKCC